MEAQPEAPPGVYSPLGQDGKAQFRVLLLRPRDDWEHADEMPDGMVTGTLEVRELDDMGEYETTSYAWGNAKAREQRCLNGVTMDVPKSSCTAIRPMARKDTARTLWIDALCINQTDKAERSQQVGFMGKIYSTGQRNLVYLGEGSADMTRGIAELHRIAESLKAMVEGLRLAVAERVISSREAFERVLHGAREIEFDMAMIEKVYAAPWFTRLWVVQEAALARANTCVCGDTVCDMTALLEAAEWSHINLATNGKTGDRGISCASDISEQVLSMRRAEMSSHGKLAELLDVGSRFDCNDDRDRVYAMLGLQTSAVDERTKRLLAVDYTKAVSEVWRDAVRAAILQSSNLSVLRDHPGQIRDGQFSWSPLWNMYPRIAYRVHPVCETWEAGAPNFPESVVRDMVKDGGEVLNLSGCKLGRTKNTTIETTFEPPITAENLQDLFRRARMISEQAGGQLSASAVNTIAAKLLVRNTNLKTTEATMEDLDRIGDLEWLLKTSKFQPGSVAQQESKLTPERFRQVQDCVVNIAIACRQTRFFHVEIDARLRVGSGPHQMADGDLVVLLHGGKRPAILRPAGEHYTWIGWAYVDGIMHGEAWAEFEDSGQEWEKFQIR